MMPLQKNNEPFTELDQLGASHYLLDFDQNGRWSNDTAVHIDFDNLDSLGLNLVQILVLQLHGQLNVIRENGTAYSFSIRKTT